MKMQRLKIIGPIILLLCVVAGFAGNAAAATLQNIPHRPHGAPVGTPLPNIEAAIKSAAQDLGWYTAEDAPGILRAFLVIRSHEAEVAIGYDETNFWIDYRDSVNLNYRPDGLRATKTRRAEKGPRIHKNYNAWVSRLADRISARAKNPPKATSGAANTADQILLIADELEKLDGLRQRGVLTQAEFDAQKKKLLAR